MHDLQEPVEAGIGTMRQNVKHGWIITVRHGRPHLSREVTLTAMEYEQWWAQYTVSGLAPGECPSEQLMEQAARADHLLSSGLRRAKETANSVGPGREVISDPIFNEAPLPRPPVPFVRLRPGHWGFISRAFWVIGYSRGEESHLAAIRRANLAANRLIEYASTGGNVLLCAHGYFNWMVNFMLRLKRWRRTYNGGSKFWAWRQYHRR